MFNKAIVRRPGNSLSAGITTADLGIPDIQLALKQHDQYIKALETCGLSVTVLEAQDAYPDSVFVEDTAVLTPHCAIITRPGAQSRQGEETTIHEALKSFYENIHTINSPGTLEGGDVMMVENHFYTGISARTNNDGADQFNNFLNKYGLTASTVPMKEFLHLKTGLAYLENNKLLISGEFVENPVFKTFDTIVISPEESYAANCIWINGTVIVPQGYPKTREAILDAGYPVLDVDVSEFRKLDGGLSCLSLRF